MGLFDKFKRTVSVKKETTDGTDYDQLVDSNSNNIFLDDKENKNQKIRADSDIIKNHFSLSNTQSFDSWQEYAITYFQTYGPQYDKVRFEELHNQIVNKGFTVTFTEMTNYICYLSLEEIIYQWKKPKWKPAVKDFHDNNEYPYDDKIYSSLLIKLREQNLNVTYEELVDYVSTLPKSKAQIKRELIEKEKLRNSIAEFKLSSDFNLIVGFVKKIGYNYLTTDLSRLTSIINSKGYQLNKENVESLINQEMQRQYEEERYNQFVKKIIHNNADNFDMYLENFEKIYSIDNEDSIDNEKKVEYFLNFLQYNGFNITKEDLSRQYELLKIRKLEEFISNDSIDMEITINDIDEMSGYQFECFLFNLFEKQGYEVIHTPSSYDQGADLILKGFGETIAIQAKCYLNQTVGNSAVQEIVGALKYYDADRGIVITNNYFTQSAIDLARSNNIILLNRDKLQKLLESDLIYVI